MENRAEPINATPLAADPKNGRKITDATSEEKPGIRLSKKKQFLFTLLIFLIFLCLLEGALRIFNLPPKLKQDAGLMYKANTAAGFKYTPGWSGYFAGANVHINTAGFRGQEFSPAKSSGTVRILGLGDSFTFGMAVGDDETYLAQLEELLNQDGRAKFETINTGHQNLNTRLEYDFLKERNLMNLAPDVVVLGFTMQNDTNIGSGEYLIASANEPFRASRYGKVLKKELSKISPILKVSNSSSFQRLAESVRLLQILDSSINWAYEDTITEVSYKIILEQYRDGSKSWENCRNSLLGIYDICNKHNVPLVVVLFPIFTKKTNQSFKDYPQEAKDLQEKVIDVFADLSRVKVVSIYDDLVESALTTRELRVPIDGHPNRLWHEITAKRLYTTLKELGF